jgi:hypothetical protein
MSEGGIVTETVLGDGFIVRDTEKGVVQGAIMEAVGGSIRAQKYRLQL